MKKTVFTQRVRKNYDSLSRFYDLLSGRSEIKITRLALEKMINDNCANILDLGCGTGSALVELTKMGAEANLRIGMDISFEMCRKARQKTGKLSHTFIICGDGLNPPFPRGRFDAILLSFTLELFPADWIDDLLHSVHELLDHHGRMYLVYMAHNEGKSLISRMYLFFHKKFPNVIDCRPIKAEKYLESNEFSILNQKEYSLWGLPVGLLVAEKEGR